MNGSRSYSSRPGHGEGTYEDLNRTIEGLEARLEGLIGRERSEGRRESYGAGYASGAQRGHFDDPVQSIRERQRALESQRHAPQRQREAGREAPSAFDPAILSGLLSDLRRDLRADIAGSVSAEVAGLRREMADLRSNASGYGMPDELKRDLARIAASVDGLGKSNSGTDQLRLELDTMRGMIDSLAREDTLRHLEGRWDAVEKQVAGFDPGILRDEMVNLAYRVDDIREALSSMPASETVQALEHKISGMVRMIEAIARQPSASGSELARQFDMLGSRLDEISRAIASVPAPVVPEMDTAPFERLEARLGAVARKIESLDGGPAAHDLGSRIESLAARVSNLAGEEAVSRLDGRLEALQRLVADTRGDVRPGEVAAHLNELARKIDAIGNRDFTQPLTARLDDLARRIDEVAAAPATESMPPSVIGRLEQLLGRAEKSFDRPQIAVPGIESLEGRLNDIAARLEKGTPPSGPIRVTGLENLETRLADLSKRLDTLPPQQGGPVRVAGIEALERRVAELSSRLDAAPSNAWTGELENRLADIARRLDQKPQAMDLNYLDSRLSEISDRLDRQMDTPATAALETRLADIAARLDNFSMAPAGSTPSGEEALRGLEAQIANLSRLVSASPQTASGTNGIEQRLASIEEHLQTSDEYVIEAARQAAETAIAAFSGHASSSGSGAQSIANIEIVSALADDLKALETLSHKSDDRTMRAFEAVQDTLLKIASRLERLDTGLPRQPSAAAAYSPVDEPEQTARTITRYDDGSDDHDFDDLDEDGDFLAQPMPKRGKVSPAEAAAMAAAFAASEEGEGELQSEDLQAGTKSLFSGLKSKLRPAGPAGKQPARVQEPQLSDIDTPSIDPAYDIDPATANLPLEPGSGAPDINRILQKVREAQSQDKNRGETVAGAGGKAEFLESARRAAMAAAAEVETIGKDRKTAEGRSVGEALKARRRPILMAAGAVLLAIMSLPLISGLIGGSDEAGEPMTVESGITPMSSMENPAEPAAPDEAAEPVLEDTADGAPDMPLPAEELAVPASADADPLPQVRVIEVPEEPAPAEDVSQAMDISPDTMAAEIEALPEAVAPAALKAAAKNGEPLAFFEIGARFTEGRGTPVDLAQAANWYRHAADMGHAPSQYRLANFYEKGSGIERDLEAARKWYQMAAEQGNASAMHNLAVLHATSGPAPDYERAFEWFQQAAEVGVRDSQVNLAILYARGDGVQRDLAESYKWFAIAANDGDKDAASKRDEVFNSLRPEQAEAARAAVADFKAQPLDPEVNQPTIPAEWGGAELHTASIDMTKAIRNIQAILNNNGFDAGTPDGVMGKKTIGAIKAFQSSIGMEADGEVSDALVKELLALNR